MGILLENACLASAWYVLELQEIDVSQSKPPPKLEC